MLHCQPSVGLMEAMAQRRKIRRVKLNPFPQWNIEKNTLKIELKQAPCFITHEEPFECLELPKKDTSKTEPKKCIRLTTWDVKNPVSSKYWEKLPTNLNWLAYRTPKKKRVWIYIKTSPPSFYSTFRNHGASALQTSGQAVKYPLSYLRGPRKILPAGILFTPLVCSKGVLKQPTTLEGILHLRLFCWPSETNPFIFDHANQGHPPSPSLFDLALACAPEFGIV